MAAAWLFIERIENWQVDQAVGFTVMGLSARYKKAAAAIGVGDLVFSYVSSGISAFADMRQVTSADLRPIPRNNDYDSTLDFYVATAPVLVLKRKSWLPLKQILSDLDLTKDRTEWAPMFRTSLRKLSDSDAVLIRGRLEVLNKA